MNTPPQNTPFKQTEIGLIPQDWEFVQLKTFCKSSAFGPRFSGELYNSNGNVATLRTTDLDLQGNINYFTMPLAQLDINKFKEHILIEDDFLITRSGTCGIAAVFKSFEKAVLPGAFLIRFRFKDNLDVNFLKQYVNSPLGQSQMEQISLGAVQKNISGTSLLNTFFPIPSFPEQTAIATALSDADALIGSLEKLIHKKRLLKQATMQHLLTPKEDWEVKKLGEIGECIIGLTYSPNDVKESGRLVLRSSNVQEGVLKYDNNVYVDVKIPEKLIVRKDDILICVRNGSRDLIGKCALIDDNAVGETFGAFMSVFRSLFNRYVFILFQSSIIKKQIDEHLGATINQITNKSLNSFEIPFPPLEEQTRIATILSDMDAELSGLEGKLEKYRQLKQGMMQQLLTGKIRLVG